MAEDKWRPPGMSDEQYKDYCTRVAAVLGTEAEEVDAVIQNPGLLDPITASVTWQLRSVSNEEGNEYPLEVVANYPMTGQISIIAADGAVVLALDPDQAGRLSCYLMREAIVIKRMVDTFDQAGETS